MLFSVQILCAEESTETVLDTMPEQVEKTIEGAKGKLNKIKKSTQDNILKRTGKPTDGSLSKKDKKAALSNSENKGYYGTLPNIEKEFEYLRQQNKSTNFGGKYKDTLIDEMNLKKTPLDDELFLDVILKKEKDTKYTKDVLRIIPVLEKFKECIAQSCDIQKFNANVNLVDLYSRRLEKDYGNTENAATDSYYLIRNISYLAKVQGNLKYEANFYSKYMPLTGTIYSKENILQKDYELLNELNRTIFILEQLK